MVSTSFAEYPTEVLMQAVALQESRDNDKAVGDKHLSDKAYGHLQIRQPCVDDVNRKLGTQYKAEDCLKNRELSELIFREYINLYATKKKLGRTPTPLDMAGIWNGGPLGWKSKHTVGYRKSVARKLEAMDASDSQRIASK
jgi:hypothetical protein